MVGEYPSLCSQQGNNCEFQRSIINTPTISSVTQTGSSVTIQGTGFSSNFESNIISIGESGSCTVQSASATTLVCSIINAPSGQQSLQLNIAGKGLASTPTNYVVNVPLTITSFNPNGGDAGGGYIFNVVGTGFSSNALITLGENFCLNQSVSSFTTIQCIAPPSSSSTLNQVRVTVNDGPNSALAPSMFTYNTTASPTITSINPIFVLMSGGVLTINGTGFGSGSISVLIDTVNARILSASNNQILVNVPSIRPGLHPIRVRTSVGFARPLFHLEYRFYVQQISPQVGSAYGGNDIYLNGVGFENRTRVQLRDGNDQTSPCQIISIQSNQIHCQTTAIKRQMNITSYGSHPSYGFGYSWNPIRQTVQQGTVVNWFWDATQLSTPAFYRVQQVGNAYSTTPLAIGFDSGPATASGRGRNLLLSLTKIHFASSSRFIFVSIRCFGNILLLVPECQSLDWIRDAWGH